MTAPGLDAIALGDAQLEDAAADLGCGLHLGCLDVSGDTESIGGWRRIARGGQTQARRAAVRRVRTSWCFPEHASGGGLHMADELVERSRLGKTAAQRSARQDALPGEEDEYRGHDRQVGQ